MSEASVLQARLVGALFVERGLLSEEQLERALELQAESGDLLGEILVTEFEISRIELASVLAEQWAELEQSDDPLPEDDVADEPDRPRGTAASRRRIGEIFVERGFVDEGELDAALTEQKESGQPLGEVLIERGSLSRLDLASALAEQWAGLEKLRPPAPKRVEGWQQVAPAEHAAAAAQGATRPAGAERTIDPSLVDVVTALTERVAAVEANGSAEIPTDDLGASIRALAARVESVEADLAGDTPETTGALQDALEELRARVAQPAERLELVEGRVNELETDRSALEAVRSRLAALEKRIAEQASRDDLDGTAGELSTRLDAIDAGVAEAASGSRAGLDAVLATVADVQERLDALAATQEAGQHEHAELAALEQRLDEIAAAIAALHSLTGRLEILETAAEATPWRTELSALEAALADLATASGSADELTVRVAAVEAAAAATPWRDEVAELRARLDDLSSSTPIAEELRERLAAVEARAAATPWREELAAVQPRIDQVSATTSAAVADVATRLAAVEAGGSEPASHEDVAALRERLQELATSGVLVDRLMERVAALEAREQGTISSGELAAVQEQLADLTASRSVTDGLVERLRTLEASAATTPWRDDLTALQARLDELGAAALATDDLGARIAAVEAAFLERPWRVELGRLADELGVRLDGLAERVDQASGAPQLDEVRVGLERVEERLGQMAPADHGHAEIAGLQARLEEVAAAGPSAELIERLAALETGARERPWQKELRRLGDELGVRLDGLAGRVDEASETGIALDELRSAMAAVAERQEQAARIDHGHDEIGALERRVDELAAAAEAVDEVARRVAAVETAGRATPWRADVAALATRLDDVTEQLAHVPHGEVAELRSDLDALRESAAASEQGSTARLVGLGKRVDAIAQITEALQAAEEAGASAAERSELERVERLVEEIGTTAHDAARSVESVRTQVEESAAADAAARQTIETELQRRLDSQVEKVRGELDAIGGRLEVMTERVGEVARTAVAGEHLESALQAQESRLVARLGAYDEGIVQLRQRVEEIAGLDSVLGERLAAVEGTVAARLDQGAAALAAEASSSRQSIEALASRLAELEPHVTSTPGALHMLHTELASLASRLEAAENTVASQDDDQTVTRLEEIERRLEAEAAQADERTKITERALRKGLATLGERLAETETEYAQAGNALRRSIERLGRAIEQTDAHLADADPPVQVMRDGGAYVAFAPTAEGYRLIVVDEAIPEVGHTVQLEGHESLLVVTRIGASPIPLDTRPCAYLERTALT